MVLRVWGTYSQENMLLFSPESQAVFVNNESQKQAVTLAITLWTGILLTHMPLEESFSISYLSFLISKINEFDKVTSKILSSSQTVHFIFSHLSECLFLSICTYTSLYYSNRIMMYTEFYILILSQFYVVAGWNTSYLLWHTEKGQNDFQISCNFKVQYFNHCTALHLTNVLALTLLLNIQVASNVFVFIDNVMRKNFVPLITSNYFLGLDSVGLQVQRV